MCPRSQTGTAWPFSTRRSGGRTGPLMAHSRLATSMELDMATVKATSTATATSTAMGTTARCAWPRASRSATRATASRASFTAAATGSSAPAVWPQRPGSCPLSRRISSFRERRPARWNLPAPSVESCGRRASFGLRGQRQATIGPMLAGDCRCHRRQGLQPRAKSLFSSARAWIGKRLLRHWTPALRPRQGLVYESGRVDTGHVVQY
mmetsp:Transcript_149876/g.364060  ORF Transcript_149876/g.364060 Transcript_149876/m.364060 type:complete len:208 (+) Transcript_149876:471-1094(+)